VRKIRDWLANNLGQSLVEITIVVPVLSLMLFGIVEFGRVYNETMVVTAAAREGARSASLGNSNATAKAAATNYLSATEQLTAVVTISPSAPTAGSAVTATVTNKVEIYTPLISSFFSSNPVIVTGTAVMRVE